MRPLFALLLLVCAGIAHAASPDQLRVVRELMADRAKLPEAKAALERLVSADARNAELHSLLGVTKLRLDDAEGAVKSLEQAVALAPGNSELHRQLGDAYGRTAQKAGALSKLGWAKKCRAAYEKAVELDPKSVNARLSLMGYYQNAPGIAGGGMDKAYAQAHEVKKLDVDRGRMALANLYVADKKFAEAFAEFEEVLKTAPDNYAALYQIGRLAAVTGERLDAGFESLQRCLTLTPPEGQPGHAAAHWRLGNIWEKRGNKASARAAYEAALALDPQFRSASESLKKLN